MSRHKKLTTSTSSPTQLRTPFWAHWPKHAHRLDHTGTNTFAHLPEHVTKPRTPVSAHRHKYEGVSKSFRTGRLERELQIVQLSATRCSCVSILWVTLVSFTAITYCLLGYRLSPEDFWKRPRKQVRKPRRIIVYLYLYLTSLAMSYACTALHRNCLLRKLRELLRAAWSSIIYGWFSLKLTASSQK
jgi:hypothetical protein